MDEKKLDNYRTRQRNRARLKMAWKLFMELRLKGALPRDAIVQTEAAMEVWQEYEGRLYTEIPQAQCPAGSAIEFEIRPVTPNAQPSHGTQAPPPVSHPGTPLSQADMPFYTPDRQPGDPGYVPPALAHTGTKPQTPPKPPLDFSGRWITRGGALMGVVSTTRGKFPYAGGLYGRAGSRSGMFWDEEGRAVSPETDRLVPDCDLMERAFSPGGHRMDYPPEDLKKEESNG